MKSFKLLQETIHGPSPKNFAEEDHEIEKIHSGIWNHYKEHSKQHQAGIFNYTRLINPNSYNLNKELQSKKPLSNFSATLDRHLTNMMANPPPAPHDFHVYTGIKEGLFSKQSKMKKVPNKDTSVIKARLPAYTSTSLRRTIASSFAKHTTHDGAINETLHLLKIHIPEGSKHGSYIAHHADMQHENEFLINKGKKLHIHPEPEHHETSNTYIWHAKIVE